MGHARALLALPARSRPARRRARQRALSVRETERLVNDILHPEARQARVKARTGRDIQRLEEEVVGEARREGANQALGKQGSGRLVINYMSHEHLDDLLARLTER